MADIMEYQMFIDGNWTPGSSGEMMEVINPANREVVARVPRGNKDDVDKALASARTTFESGIWANKSVDERAQVLMDAAMLAVANKDRLAYLESLTSGATIRRTSTVDAAEVSDPFTLGYDSQRASPGGTCLLFTALGGSHAQLLET